MSNLRFQISDFIRQGLVAWRTIAATTVPDVRRRLSSGRDEIRERGPHKLRAIRAMARRSPRKSQTKVRDHSRRFAPYRENPTPRPLCTLQAIAPTRRPRLGAANG